MLRFDFGIVQELCHFLFLLVKHRCYNAGYEIDQIARVAASLAQRRILESSNLKVEVASTRPPSASLTASRSYRGQGESSCEAINEARDRGLAYRGAVVARFVISAHSGNSIQMGIFSRLPRDPRHRRPISSLRSAKNPQVTHEAGERVEDLNICIIGVRVCGRGCHIRMSI